MAQNSEGAVTPAESPVIITNTSPSSQEQVDNEELVKTFCISLRPCNILEDRSFLEFMKNNTLPSKEEFTGELLPEVYNRARLELMETLKAVQHVAISIEMWRWGTGYSIMLTATAHFVHQSKFVSRTLFTTKIQQFAIENVPSAIKDGLIKWQVLHKVTSVTGSRENVMVGELKENDKDISKIFRIACLTDVLENISKSIATHLNLYKLADDCNFKIELEDFPDYLWHNLYFMLKRISEDNAGSFTEDERKAYSECFQMLKIVNDLNNKLSRQQYITLSSFYPLFLGLKLKINKWHPSSSLAKEIKLRLEQIVEGLDFFQSNSNLNINLNINALKATFLDPRFKKTILKYYDEAEDLFRELETELKECIEAYNQENTALSATNTHSEENDDVLDYLTDEPENTLSRAKAMMAQYVTERDLQLDENPFKFWEDFSSTYKYGEFHMMALKYLGMPANAIPIETVSGGYPSNYIRYQKKYNQLRSSLDYENINEMLFLYSYYSTN